MHKTKKECLHYINLELVKLHILPSTDQADTFLKTFIRWDQESLETLTDICRWYPEWIYGYLSKKNGESKNPTNRTFMLLCKIKQYRPDLAKTEPWELGTGAPSM